MIDIHSHILPNIDDGPDSLSQAFQTLLKAHNQGVATIIATPHSIDGVYNAGPEDILEKCSTLNFELKKRNIPLAVLPGSEIRLTHDIAGLYDSGKLMTLNNSDRFILIELPPMFILDGVVHIIKQLAQRGLTTIIAHPERNRSILKNLNILPKLMYQGAQLQITAQSLLGGFGKKSRSISEKLLKNDMVSFIASDSHPERPYLMKKAFEKTTQLAGSHTAKTIFKTNPEQIIRHTEKGINYVK